MARSPRIPSARVLLPLLVLALVGLAVPAARAAAARAATATATVTGVVTAGGAPLAGAEVLSQAPAGSTATSSDASGHYTLTVDLGSTTVSASVLLDFISPDPARHAVSVELPVTVAAGKTITKNVALSQLDARLVATIAGVPSGTDPATVRLWAGQAGTQLAGVATYTPGRPVEIDGLAGAGHLVDVAYGAGSDTIYYPGTRLYGRASVLTLKAGCTTSLSANLAAGTMKVTGRDCSRAPACISARGSAARAAAALAHDRTLLKKDKRRLKKAKKHHRAAKKIKKLKKKVKKATKVVRRASATAVSATAAAAASCR